MTIAYSGVALFLILIIVVLERTKKVDSGFSDYATAGRSFGPFYGTMAYLNTFLPGTVFVSFAGLAASSGVIGFYNTVYGLIGLLIMFGLAKPVYTWGKKFDLRTQADLLGLRYNSKAVRITAAIIGVVATLPWIVLGMQSLALVFRYLSFGAVSAFAAVLISVAVIVIRQFWTVKYGMRGIIVSDMIQGIFAYFAGTVIAFGLIVWLLMNGHGGDAVPDSFYSLPGAGSDLGPLYVVAIILTGALGTWCWPDIFVRLFTADSARTVQRTGMMVAPIMLVFGTALTFMAILASSVPGVSDAPDDVWFITAGVGGVLLITAAAICVVGATMGNIGANLQAVGAQCANDIYGVAAGSRVQSSTPARIAVTVTTVIAAIGAFLTANTASGLVNLALISYQGIVQLAPTLLLGIFWKRGNAAGAVSAMVSGFAIAAVLQSIYPISIPWLGGLTSGVAALAVNIAVYVACAYLMPHSDVERKRVDDLWLAFRQPADIAPADSVLDRV